MSPIFVRDLIELGTHSSPPPLKWCAREPVWWVVQDVLWPCGLSAHHIQVCGVSGRVNRC
jgi:hypothetical protein